MIIKVPVNKSKAIRQFIWLVLLLLVFIVMSVLPQLFVKSGSGGFIKVVGYAGTFIFTVCTAFVAQKVFNKKPGLIIDNDGIIDNSLGVMFAKVGWANVTEINHLQSEGRHYIKISVKHPEKYIAAETNTVKRKMLELNYSTLKTPINVAASRLKMDFDKLYALVVNAFEEHRSF